MQDINRLIRQMAAIGNQMAESLVPIINMQQDLAQSSGMMRLREELLNQAEVARQLSDLISPAVLRGFSQTAEAAASIDIRQRLLTYPLSSWALDTGMSFKGVWDAMQPLLEQVRAASSIQVPQSYFAAFSERLEEEARGDRATVEAVVNAHTHASYQSGYTPVNLSMFLLTILGLLIAVLQLQSGDRQYRNLSLEIERVRDSVISESRNIEERLFEELLKYVREVSGEELVSGTLIKDSNLISRPAEGSESLHLLSKGTAIEIVDWEDRFSLIRVQLGQRQAKAVGWVPSKAVAVLEVQE